MEMKQKYACPFMNSKTNEHYDEKDINGIL